MFHVEHEPFILLTMLFYGKKYQFLHYKYKRRTMKIIGNFKEIVNN